MNEDNKNNPNNEDLDPILETDPQERTTINFGSPINNNESIPQTTSLDRSSRRFFNKLSKKFSIYIPIFVILLITIAIVTINSYKSSNSSNNGALNEQNLTAQNLRKLANSNTTVGNSNQLLTVQSNSIFNGQVLIRNNLNVAGQFQVGGNTNLSNLTVSGNTIFNQTQINKNLSIGGNLSVQGNLTMQNDLSVNGNGNFTGTLSASQLTINNLNLNGDITFNHHIYVNGSIPSQVTGGSIGSGGTTSVNGSDSAGSVTINTGGSPSAGCYVTINFTNHFNNIPNVLITPTNSNGANLSYYINHSLSSFSICSTNTPQASQTYSYDYLVIG